MTAPLGVRFARHYFDASDPEGPTACGGNSYGFGAVSDRFDVRHPVTCKRCLASLAKRDREFQRKARRGIGAPRTADGSIIGKAWWHVQLAADCAEALCAEEPACACRGARRIWAQCDDDGRWIQCPHCTAASLRPSAADCADAISAALMLIDDTRFPHTCDTLRAHREHLNAARAIAREEGRAL